jgi:hypothetical protein|nr:MAG TPA_asm: helix-turn-helix domain protein [Caudoviricetes sp.]
MALRTEFQQKKERKYKKLYDEFILLSSEEGASITEITKLLMRKYNIHSPSTIWKIRKQFEENN